MDSGWIADSPARSIRAPKPDARSTAEHRRDGCPAVHGGAQADGVGAPALATLLRPHDSRRRDSGARGRARQRGGGAAARQSGELVTVALPSEILAVLGALQRPSRNHYFSAGRPKPETAVKYWRKRLNLVAAAADIENSHPRRLRDTFGGEMLLAGITIDDVRIPLGHGSVRTTERYYAPWTLDQARPSHRARTGSLPAGSDLAGLHTEEARGGRSPRATLKRQACQYLTFPSQPDAVGVAHQMALVRCEPATSAT